jgi:hypothetical protein
MTSKAKLKEIDASWFKYQFHFGGKCLPGWVLFQNSMLMRCNERIDVLNYLRQSFQEAMSRQLRGVPAMKQGRCGDIVSTFAEELSKTLSNSSLTASVFYVDSRAVSPLYEEQAQKKMLDKMLKNFKTATELTFECEPEVGWFSSKEWGVRCLA